MNNVIRLAIVDPKDATREALKKMLMGMDRLWLEAECSRYEFFADVVEQTNPEIGLIGLDHDPQKALTLIEQLRQAAPQCQIVVISSSTEGQLILKAMRAGVKEFLTQPVGVEDLLGALDRLGSQTDGGGQRKSRRCVVTAITGATGGVGATSLAVNLGCVLAAREENSVALVDLDLALGDADVFLDTIPEHTLLDVARNSSRLDLGLLRRSLTRHSSGLYLLPRPIQLQDAELIAAEDMQRVLGLLKATFSHLLLDLSKSYSRLDMLALNTADQILLITQLDLPCLRNVVRLLTSFEQLEGIKDKVKVIVNRVGLGSGAISLKKAQETIGREVYWQIPNDYRAMVEVRNNGIPLSEQAPKAGVTQAICSLADALSGGEAVREVEPANGGGWLNFWPGKPKAKSRV